MIKHLSLLLCLVFLTFWPPGVHAQIIFTIAGNGTAGYFGNGVPATTAALDSSTCIITDAVGNLYINDERNFCVRMVDTAGIITTIAGKDSAGYTGDNGPATNATFKDNWGIALDGDAMTLYIADAKNHVLRKVTPVVGGTITTCAGDGTYGDNGDGGPASAARLKTPVSLAMDHNGNLYIGDQDFWGVRKIDASGTITKFAGGNLSGYAGDGGLAVAAKFNHIFGLAADNYGNVYICDADNNRVRKVDAAGIVTTIAGIGIAGYNGDGIPATTAKLNNPTGVFVSNSGDIYIADEFNNRVRKINPAGIITTFAGTGSPGFGGDGGPAIAAQLYSPVSVTMDVDENIYVSDMDNVRIRKIVKSLSFTGGHFQHLSICENTPAASLNILLSIRDYNTGLMDTCRLVSGPSHGSAIAFYTTTATGGTFTPAGLSYTPAVGYSGNDTFRVAVTNGMATDTTTIYVTIIPSVLSAGTITGASSVCEGSSITLTDSAAGGVWSSNGNTTLNPISNGCIVTGVHTGIDTVTYTVSNSCGTARARKTVVVNTLPDPGTITGPNAVCLGSTITLTDAAPDGLWSVSTGKASVSAGIVKGLVAGVDTVIYTVTNTRCKASAKFPVTIDTFPDAGKIIGPSVVCLGSQIMLSDSVAGGVWSCSDTTVSVVAGVVTGISTGSGVISYSITNACGTAAATFSITIGSLPDVPEVTQHESVFYAPAGYSSYQWTHDGVPIPGATADTYAVAIVGNYAVTVTNNYGCSTVSLPQTYSGCGADDIKIFPNPTSSTFHIQWCKKVTVRVQCDDGKIVKILKNVDEIDIGELPNGVYFIVIYDKNGIYVKSKKLTKLSN